MAVIESGMKMGMLETVFPLEDGEMYTPGWHKAAWAGFYSKLTSKRLHLE